LKNHIHGSGFHGSPVEPRDAQARQVVAPDVLLAGRDQRADQRGGDAQGGDPVALDHVPDAVGLREVRRPLIKEHRRAERPGADDLPRTHDPAEVADPEQDLVLPEVGLVGDLGGDLHEEPAVDEHGALRPPGGPARVRDHERVFGVELLGLEPAGLALQEFVPPDVAGLVPFLLQRTLP
jgi:hypothetical protein